MANVFKAFALFGDSDDAQRAELARAHRAREIRAEREHEGAKHVPSHLSWLISKMTDEEVADLESRLYEHLDDNGRII